MKCEDLIKSLKEEVESLKAENANYITAINNMHTPEEVETLKKEDRILEDSYQFQLRRNEAIKTALKDKHTELKHLNEQKAELQSRIDRAIQWVKERNDSEFGPTMTNIDELEEILRGEE